MNILSVTPAPVKATQLAAPKPDINNTYNADEPMANALSSMQPPSLQKQAVLKLASSIDNLDHRLQSVAEETKNVEKLCRQPAACPNDYEMVDYFQVRKNQGDSLNTALNKLEDALAMRKPQQHLIDKHLQMLAGSALPSGIPGLNLGDLPQPPEPELHFAPPAPAAQKGAGGDFFLELNGMIGFIRNDYLSIYETALQRYSDFYKSFNENVMSTMGSYITSSGDGKTVTILKSLSNALEAELDKVEKNQHLIGVMDKAIIERWAKVFPGSVVKDIGNGKAWLSMDISPLENMIGSLEDFPLFNGIAVANLIAPASRTLDNAKFQAWQTGFNSQESEMKNQLQILSTKYGNANSYHENFNKILSSQLSQYAEMLKSIISGI